MDYEDTADNGSDESSDDEYGDDGEDTDDGDGDGAEDGSGWDDGDPSDGCDAGAYAWSDDTGGEGDDTADWPGGADDVTPGAGDVGDSGGNGAVQMGYVTVFQAMCSSDHTTWYGPERRSEEEAMTDKQGHDNQRHGGQSTATIVPGERVDK